MLTGPLLRLAAAPEAPAGATCPAAVRPGGTGPERTGGVGAPGARWRTLRAGGPDSDAHTGEPGSTAEVQESRPELRQPPLYKVVLVNDDYTPMEFVVEVLQTFFHLDRNKATQIMLYVHTKGKGVAGVFTYQIAETKVAQVNEYSRKNQHPLLCTMEEA